MFNEEEIGNRSNTLGKDLVNLVKSTAGTTLFALATVGAQYAKDVYNLPLNPLEHSIDPSITELLPTVQTVARDAAMYTVQLACAVGTVAKGIGLAYDTLKIPTKIAIGRYTSNRRLRKLGEEL